jgi:hypothetical protein
LALVILAPDMPFIYLFYEISLLSEAHIYIVFGISHTVVVSLYYDNEMV